MIDATAIGATVMDAGDMTATNTGGTVKASGMESAAPARQGVTGDTGHAKSGYCGMMKMVRYRMGISFLGFPPAPPISQKTTEDSLAFLDLNQIDARQATAGRSTSFVFVFCEVMVSTEELKSHSKAAGDAAADGFAFVPIRTAFWGGNRLGCRT